LVAGAAHAQTDFPNRHIHMVVPYPAGGIVDIATRIVTDKLSEIWHQPIVVETKPGASGNLAWDQVSRAEPDGYTWTFLGPATLSNPNMYAKLRWSEKSFVPAGATVWGPSALVVHPSLPVNTVTEFVDHVRKNPGILNLGHPPIGSSQHLGIATFLNATKLKVMAVPYNGAPPAILDLMANRVQFTMVPVGLVVQHINSGAMKALAVLGTIRSPLLPNVPTMSEAGYPEVNLVPWYGYGVPRGTPRPVIDKIVAGFNEVMKVPSIRVALEHRNGSGRTCPPGQGRLGRHQDGRLWSGLVLARAASLTARRCPPSCGRCPPPWRTFSGGCLNRQALLPREPQVQRCPLPR
jgi:tripartite-type tricarboxylate transporter receptor subunit TctC